MEKLTIFTPTFNRSKTLKVLYESLVRQEVKDFVWIVVDDGSTDDTKFYIENWIAEDKIKIIYSFQENAGKMAAHNKGVSLCATDLFVCIDSDDYLVDDAVKLILQHYERIVNDSSVCGLVAYRSNSLTEFPDGFVYSTLSELYRHGFRGETTLVFKTRILREYPFPIIDGEKFITENYVYNQIDDNYKYYVMRNVLTNSKYLNDGYTKNHIALKYENPKGYALFYKDSFKRSISLAEKCRFVVWYVAISLVGKSKLFQIVSNFPNKLLCVLAFPFGLYKFFSIKKEYTRIYKNL